MAFCEAGELRKIEWGGFEIKSITDPPLVGLIIKIDTVEMDKTKAQVCIADIEAEMKAVRAEVLNTKAKRLSTVS